MDEFSDLATLEVSVLDAGAGQRIVLTRNGQPYAAIVPLNDLRRLRQREFGPVVGGEAARKFVPWEPWEDRLLCDEQKTTAEIAAEIQRTPHSIHERRRWIKRLAVLEAAGAR